MASPSFGPLGGLIDFFGGGRGNVQRLLQATDPTRGPVFPFVAPLEHMLGIGGQAQPDTSWHDGMVQKATQSFAKPSGSAEASQPKSVLALKKSK
ncbi:MAG TPA: hypothetical protein VFB43_17920 [Terracidiphilus sp.]|nr:hypothetical protein [Terracidiphilus sp.]